VGSTRKEVFNSLETAMKELDTHSAGACTAVRITPPDIFRHQITTWNGIRSDAIQLIRLEPFEYVQGVLPLADHVRTRRARRW
jgi:hypothetical protein